MDEHEMCQNCKRDVPISNYKMHTLHCARNVSKCELCDEPVNASEMENHIKLVHSNKPCSECGQTMAVIQLEEHRENECPKRRVICSFCEIHVKAEEQESHEGYCGSRTEKCQECGDFVMLKDWVKHSEMRLYHELANKPCAEVFGHSDFHPTFTPSTLSRGPNDFSWSPSILAGPPQLAFSTASSSRLEERRHSSSSSNTRMSSSSRLDSSIPDLEIVSSRKSSLTGGGGGLSSRLLSSSSANSSRNASFDFPDRHYQSPTGFDFSVPTEEDATQEEREKEEEEGVSIPCEFCGIGIDMYKLILHQTKCDRNPDSTSLRRPSFTSLSTSSYPGPPSSSTGPNHMIARIENDLKSTRTSSASNGAHIVSDTIAAETSPSLRRGSAGSNVLTHENIAGSSSRSPLAPRRSSLRKDSIVEKYLSKPSNDGGSSSVTLLASSSNGPYGGARAKTTFTSALPPPGPSPMEPKREEPKRRKASAPFPSQALSPSYSLPSPKSSPNLQNYPRKTTGGGGGGISSLSSPSAPATPLMSLSRKQSTTSNGERDGREDLRQLLENMRKDPFDDDLENNDGSFFPCEFCGDPYPVEYLMRHQVRSHLSFD
eukprot:TRINITY_DN6142_c0_g1_i1.p1 TRINITY_DN6142_c0_g1~~TRINITY_DN6142_c0_g1_i1.p1  ORF type:complete len:600 (-),score=128.41 TRINITY_DN6142_c0_g1_i1:100-1899(-)